MKYWKDFFEQFNTQHGEFVNSISKNFPGLTMSEFKVCCLLRAGYTNPQIAKMTYSTLRGIETTRYRLRKKLSINAKENLSLFLMRL